MYCARLQNETDVDTFREKARAAIAQDIAPDCVDFMAPDGQRGLFVELSIPASERKPKSFFVPREFVDLVKIVTCHRDPERFNLLYAALWRIRDNPHFFQVASDPLVRRLDDMARAVRRDRHKMTAFVRFRELIADGETRFVAWFEPDHFIEALVAPFFIDRFASMHFAIITPRKAIIWNGALNFGPGGRRDDAPTADGFSAAWEHYYRAIFNPARLSPKAMLKEMPKKYWRNLPETRHVATMMASASARESDFIAAAPTLAPARVERIRLRQMAQGTGGPTLTSLDALRQSARDCRRCPIGSCATQIVFGEGPSKARAIFVGEQPGDQEDLSGRPFVGPAGALLNNALREAKLLREELYLTNAVKHFKFEPRGKRRLHKTPKTAEIESCRWWLTRELELIEAPVIVTLGATALHAITGGKSKGFTLTSLRGKVLDVEGRALIATVHPAYLLRLPDARLREEERTSIRRRPRTRSGDDMIVLADV